MSNITDSFNNYIYAAGYNNSGGSNYTDYIVTTDNQSRLIVNPTPAAPTATGASRCGTGTVTLTAAGAPAGGSYRWYTVATGGTPISGATGSSYTTPSLTQTTTYYVSTVSDLACESSRTAVTATVNQVLAPTATNGSRCGTGTVTLTATPGTNGNIVRWYDASSGGSHFHEGTSYTTPSLSSTTTYFVSSYSTTTGCEGSTRTAVTATINPIPAAPTTTGGSRCGPGDVNLSAAGAPTGGLYRWYDTQTSTTILLESSSTSVIATNVQATRDFWVSAVDASTGCESERTRVTATINPIPAAPTTTNGSRCGPGSVTLSAAGAPAGGTYRWYTVATGGTAITGATSDTYTTPSISATTTYYVSAMSAQNCEGPRTAVTATINPIPAAPTTTGGSRCGPGTVNLS
ncbi:hypothetical protein ABID22_003499, partial [Pontibacter aydingkolensis]|uniref:immunoglobulin domain-containing protein n=1 Tax=Pontibacter aydingkolensis TaxID=1911536 RepID=UPI003470C7C3